GPVPAAGTIYPTRSTRRHSPSVHSIAASSVSMRRVGPGAIDGERIVAIITSVTSRDTERDLITVGELARRTGLSAKTIREFEARDLIYSAGRSESNYRLFDEQALWCVQVVGNLRALGLTLKEIEELAVLYQNQPEEAAGPRLGLLLERAERRVGG